MTLYNIFSFLDYAIYSMVKFVVRLIIIIANYNFFKTEVIDEISGKVYVALGVLVLFKIVISAIQYMVNPDVFDDKDKGMVGILKKTVISIALLALVRPIFDFAMNMQVTIVSTIPGLVLGNGAGDYRLDQNNSDDIRKKIDGIGDQVAGSTIWAFVTLKDTTEEANKDVKIDANLVEWDKNSDNKTLDSFRERITAGCDGGGPILNVNFDTHSCSYDYRILISTAAGLFLLYVLVSMSLDVGIRAIKLGIIEILAPIPIASYIVSKDKLSKFFKLATKVYLDLFVRLGVIYFVIFFITKVIEAIGDKPQIAGGHYVPQGIDVAFIKVIIIIALFMFAKNAPKFICEVLGIDGGGFGDMADMFKPAWQRTGGLAAAGAAIGAYRNSRQYGEGGFKAARRALGAGANATVSRLKAIASGKSLSESYKAAKDAASARTMKNLEYANRFPNWKDRQRQIWQERFDRYTGVTTGGKKASGTISAANTLLEGRSHSWNRAESKVLEAPGKYTRATTIGLTGARAGTTRTITVSEMLSRMKELEGGATASYDNEYQDLVNNRQKILDTAKREFIEKSFSAANGDGQQRNVFAEDIFKFMRSGGDSATIGKVLVKDNFAYEDSTGATQHINLNLKDVANKIAAGQTLGAAESEALSYYIATQMNNEGGRMRVEATKTQTSEPKSS